MGEIPEWYRTLKAAQILNVPPWDLAEMPLVWQEWALTAEMAESAVRKEKARHNTPKSKPKKGKP